MGAGNNTSSVTNILKFSEESLISKESPEKDQYKKAAAEAEELVRRGVLSPFKVPSPRYYGVDPKGSDEFSKSNWNVETNCDSGRLFARWSSWGGRYDLHLARTINCACVGTN
jgi:hypothetical protein